MSFIARLFSWKQQKGLQSSSTRAVYTHEEDDFVHVSHVKTRESEADDEADVSKWEMARILGHLDVKVQPKVETLGDIKKYRTSKSSKTAAVKEHYVDDRYVIDDPSELDMFDDKLNRVIKRSHRRKTNFPEKSKF